MFIPIKTAGVVLASAFALALVSAPPAQAISFSYEGFISYNLPGGQGGTDIVGDFADLDAVLEHNATELQNTGLEKFQGITAGDIQEIGKHNVDKNVGEPGAWDDGLFGDDALTSFSCLDAADPCENFSFAFDPTALSTGGVPLSDWTLVKILIKVGQTGGEPGYEGHGVWLVEDGDIDDSVIEFDDFAAFLADVLVAQNLAGVPDNKLGLGGNSHVHFFGVGSNSVPEPGALALLGVGLMGLAMLGRRRRRN